VKVVYTDSALQDLDAILNYLALHFPDAYQAFETRLLAIERRIGQWPRSARRVAERPGVRIVPLVRSPYNVFYRIRSDAVEIPHIRHGARRDP
jgi:plasmid stabilization system protein ParE